MQLLEFCWFYVFCYSCRDFFFSLVVFGSEKKSFFFFGSSFNCGFCSRVVGFRGGRLYLVSLDLEQWLFVVFRIVIFFQFMVVLCWLCWIFFYGDFCFVYLQLCFCVEYEGIGLFVFLEVFGVFIIQQRYIYFQFILQIC